MTAVSFTKEWIKTEQAVEDVETHHRNKYNILEDVTELEIISSCRYFNPKQQTIITKLLCFTHYFLAAAQ